jgi:hypothetical protein
VNQIFISGGISHSFLSGGENGNYLLLKLISQCVATALGVGRETWTLYLIWALHCCALPVMMKKTELIL